MTRKEKRDRDNAKCGYAGLQYWNTGATEKQIASDKRETELDLEYIREKAQERAKQ